MSNSIDSDCSLWRISSLCFDVLRSCALRISSDVFHCLKMKCYMKASYLNCYIINKDKCNLLFWTKYNKKEKKKNNGLMVFLLINRFYPEFFLCLNLSMFITNEFSTVKCCIQIWKHLPWEWREHYTYRVSQTYPFKGLYSWTNKKSQIMHMHLKNN